MWKIILLLGIMCTLLFTINGQERTEQFVEYWKWVALGFASCFVVWQTIVLVNFAYRWSMTWYKALVQTESKVASFFWRASLWFIGLLLVLFAAFGYLLMAFVYTKSPSGVSDSHCEINKWFVLATGCGCILVFGPGSL